MHANGCHGVKLCSADTMLKPEQLEIALRGFCKTRAAESAEVQAVGIRGRLSGDTAGDVSVGQATWLGPLSDQS